MTGTFFLDSSALIKLYHQEPGTERVEEIFAASSTALFISELAAVELQSALARKVRTGEITVQAEEEPVRNFEQDCADRFVIEPLTSAVVQQAKDLLKKHGHQRALRSLDALQVATFAIVRAREEAVFVCADGRLCGVAKAEGSSALNPEEPVA
ncbi:MAG TPA: type II toxin-antitoxin system VapC family toxin [Candidatus Acidoferrales bacterium]|nr:type II toxin-antitoxin system VapC family toxin [Candidatus Acidoferrales bacterium]